MYALSHFFNKKSEQKQKQKLDLSYFRTLYPPFAL